MSDLTPAELDREEWEAIHPPVETDAFWCEPCEYEYEVAEGQDVGCPICSREGRKL